MVDSQFCCLASGDFRRFGGVECRFHSLDTLLRRTVTRMLSAPGASADEWDSTRSRRCKIAPHSLDRFAGSKAKVASRSHDLRVRWNLPRLESVKELRAYLQLVRVAPRSIRAVEFHPEDFGMGLVVILWCVLNT